ncbi:MAG: UvrD-helicase domain-containing protein [Clostridia bacterium]
MELSKKQLEIINAKEDKIVVIASAAAGKAQPNDTIIPTPKGYRTIGELKPGDEVFNRFGKPEKVLQVFPQGKKQVYIVTFADGRKTECCGEHLWSYNNGHSGFTIKELNKMYESGWVTKDNRGHNSYKYRIPVLKKSVCYPKKTFSIDPYTIGAFIGDGCCTEKDLTISSSDEWIVKKIATINGFTYKRRSQHNYSWDFFKDGTRVKTNLFFKDYKEELCCYCIQKRIPKEYLLGDTEQRMQLLQGLMDTDGTTGDGRNSPSYATNSKQLAEDVLELIRSLGFYGQIFIEDRRDSGKNIEYKVNIFCGNKNTYKIFSLPKKIEKALNFKDKKQRTNHNFDSIINIEKTSKYKEMTCILVDDNEHLYLTNNFIVTHNTAVLTERIRYLINNGVNPKELVAITFTNLAAEEIRERVGDIAKDCFIGTVHSYCNYLLISAGVETRELLDEEQFDELFEKIKEHPECIKYVDHLLLDEAQDSNYAQFEFLIDSIQPKHFMLVGDHRQSIYRFNGAAPTALIDLTKQPDVKVYSLNENYRNGIKILDYAKMIIRQNGYDYLDNSIPMRKIDGRVVTVEYSPTAIARTIKKMGGYKNWFILSRWNKDIEQIANACEATNVPYSIIRKKDFSSNEELRKKMEEDTVKIMTIHASKGLEADNVVVIGATFNKKGTNEEKEENLCVNYVAATRAKNLLVWTYKHQYRKDAVRSWE